MGKFDEEIKRLRQPRKTASLWADKDFSVGVASIVIYMTAILLVGGFDGYGDFLRLLTILITFWITHTCVRNGFFKD